MSLTLTALILKWSATWLTLVLIALAFPGPSPGKAAVIALLVAVLSWAADRVISFRVQGVTRWVIDSGLAALTIYGGQIFWPGPPIGFVPSLVAGFAVGAVEIPLHIFLASRFGLRRPDDRKDGVR